MRGVMAVVVADHNAARASVRDVLQDIGAEALFAKFELDGKEEEGTLYLRGLDDDQVVHTGPAGFHASS